MGKSYWMKDQQGNFSNKQNDTFDEKKRYIGLRLQQGVPLLDRDWNELEDIRRYEEQMLRKHYIGNGSPDDGFKIIAAEFPNNVNNFIICEGRCLVDGFEVLNEPSDQKKYLYYTDQNNPVPLNTPTDSDRLDTVYLDVWIQEVRSKSQEKTDNSKDDEPEIIDHSLGNIDDVGMETTIRHKLVWRVSVDEGSKGEYKKKYVPIKPEKADKLAKLVIDSKDKYIIRTDEKLELGKGYSLKAKNVDVDGKNVCLELDKDEQYIADHIVSTATDSDKTWVCKQNGILNEDDVVVLKVHVNKVFQGTVDSIALIEGLWLIDFKNPMPIEKIDELYHHYYDLAKITRSPMNNEITDIVDLREVRGKDKFPTLTTHSLTLKNDSLQPEEWPKMEFEEDQLIINYSSGDIIINSNQFFFTKGKVIADGNWTFKKPVKFYGNKSGYVVDRFINLSGGTLHTGDIVKLSFTPVLRFQGHLNKIPIVGVTLADKENDTSVVGIVDVAVSNDDEALEGRSVVEDQTSVEEDGELFVVILGAYSHCKVDATEIPVEVGDLLTSSENPGHAKKATDPKIGSIIGKALEPLKEGTGCISVFVNIQ